jgi:hypothetical protein
MHVIYLSSISDDESDVEMYVFQCYIYFVLLLIILIVGYQMDQWNLSTQCKNNININLLSKFLIPGQKNQRQGMCLFVYIYNIFINNAI